MKIISYFSEKFVRNLGPTISIAVLAYPLFLLISTGNMIYIITALLIFAFLMSFIESVLTLSMANLFPISVRLSGVSIGYNVATSFFGGTAPLVCTYFIHETSMIDFPAYYLIVACLIALPGVLTLPRKILQR